MTNKFTLEQLAEPRIQLAATLGRGQYMVIRRGGRDLETQKKARAKFNRLNAKIPSDSTLDVVAQVRKYRDGLDR